MAVAMRKEDVTEFLQKHIDNTEGLASVSYLHLAPSTSK